jgi:uncharacterized protein involved in response to NO
MTRQENIQKRRDYNGPAFFSGGFRPFFFGAGAFAIINVALWVSYVSGHDILGLTLTSTWHAHEMLFGFVAAAVAGFALTAIPNWTGQLPLRGLPLALLFLVWVLGRTFMLLQLPYASVVDSLFLILLALFAGREVWAGKNWRNLPVVLVFSLFASANIIYHFEHTISSQLGGSGFRLGLTSIVMLVSLIGGRIVPSFTENWLKAQGIAARTISFNMFDKAVLLTSLAILLLWVYSPQNPALIMGFFAISGLHLLRLLRWQGWRTTSEPLVLMLHLAYLWLPISFAVMALEIMLGLPNVGIHALTVGAMSSMIIAVMTRATLGHSGRQLKSDNITNAIYVAIWLAGLTRVLSFFMTSNYINWVQLSATLWVVGFGFFIIGYSRYFFGQKN